MFSFYTHLSIYIYIYISLLYWTRVIEYAFLRSVIVVGLGKVSKVGGHWIDHDGI